MKLWYLLMNFDGNSVTGMMAIADTPNEARKKCLKLVNTKIKQYRASDRDDYGNLKREIAFRRTLNNPHRKRAYSSFHPEDKRPILRIMEITKDAFHTGYWIGLSDNNYFCNVPYKLYQEQKSGVYYSELKK